MAKINDWEEVPTGNNINDWEEVSFKPQPSQLESGLRGLAQGGSLGFADELTGAAESAAGSLGLVPDKTYEQARDESRAAYQAAQKANPYTYGAGQVGGGLATAFVPGLNIAKGASIGTQALKAGIQGGLTGLGSSESEDLTQLAKDTAIGGAIGGALGGAGGYLGNKVAGAVPKVADSLDAGAENLAARSLGAERGTIRSIGPDKVRAAGRYGLDEGIVSPFASTGDKIARNEEALTRSGQAGQSVRDVIDEQSVSSFNPAEAARKVEEKSGDFWRSPLNKSATSQLDNTLEAINMRGDQPISIRRAHELLQELGGAANWKNNLNITDKERIARDAYGVVSKEIDAAVQKGADAINSPDLLQKLKDANKTYSSGKTAEKLLENKYAREQGNKMFGLTDTIAGGAGYAGGGPIAAGAIYGGKKVLEKYGTNVGAVGLDKLADIVRASPQNFGKYGNVLQKAAERGGTSLGATHYVLANSDPEYRKMLEEMNNNK